MSGPFLGVFFHWLGGLASGSFYVPFRFVKKWSWEVYWLAAGFFSWIIAPWLMALILTNDLPGVLTQAVQDQWNAVKWAYLFGLMWGLGGLTFGLTMRYLGMSLGMAIALSYCTLFGTLMPPLVGDFRAGNLAGGEFMTQIAGTDAGRIILFGLFITILGIVIAALAGMSKEREMSEEAKKAAIKEFSFAKGLLVATFSGIMSAGMSYGMAAAQPIADISMTAGTPKLWSELPRLCIILAGGFTSNFLWCCLLFVKNRTAYQFTAKEIREKDDASPMRVPMLWNYVFCAIAGTTWYFQFFFYSMGETQMGDFNFSSWPLHMASIMIFSSLWGLALAEWKGSSWYTKTVLFTTLTTLIFSTVVIGYGTYMGGVAKAKAYEDCFARIRDKATILDISPFESEPPTPRTVGAQIKEQLDIFERNQDVCKVYDDGSAARPKFTETPSYKDLKPADYKDAKRAMLQAVKRIETLAGPREGADAAEAVLRDRILRDAIRIAEMTDKGEYSKLADPAEANTVIVD